MTPTIERRRASQYSRSAGQAQPRTLKTPDGGFAFSGYVVKWDSPSEDLGGYVEIIRRGAFSKVLASSAPIVAILDHDKRVCNVLGSTASGTLVLAEDDVGLSFIAQANNTQAARDAAEILRNNADRCIVRVCCRQAAANGTARRLDTPRDPRSRGPGRNQPGCRRRLQIQQRDSCRNGQRPQLTCPPFAHRGLP